MIERIMMFANFGKFSELAKGGGQFSARRTMDTFRKLGYETIPIVRHRTVYFGRISHKIEVLSYAVIDLIKIIAKMLFKKRRGTIFIHSTYSGPLLPYEYIVSCVVRLLGFRSFMYLQGGGINKPYEKGSSFYRWLYRKTINLQTEVMFEGMDPLLMTQKLSKTKLFYYPCYTEDGFAPEKLPEKPKNVINVCYFGRIDPSKNVLVTIEAFNLLSKQYPNTHLTIIGNGQENYEKKVMDAISSSPYNDRITKMPRSDHQVIKKVLETQHFYLFPSSERVEGHSNALNEAMSYGLIPIISNNNFLPSIVDDDRLVVYDTFSPIDYTNKIIEILNKYSVGDISEKMFERVKANFVQSIVEKKLKDNLLQF